MALRDIWYENAQPGSFAGIPIDILVTQDEVELARASYQYPHRDGADFQPMGNGPRRTRCTVLFFERKPDADDDAAGFASDDHLTRFATFWQTAITAQQPYEFVHPLFGAYQAWVDGTPVVTANSDERNCLSLDVTFVEDSTSPTVILDGTVIAPYHTSTTQAAVFASAFDDEVATLNLPDDSAAKGLGTDVTSTMSSWSDPEKSVRDVNGDLNRLTDRIDDALNDIAYATSLERIPLLRTAARLHATIRRAAEAYRKTAPQLAELIVDRPQSLNAFLLKRYGAAQLERRRDEAMKLNDIPDPSYLPAGFRITLVLDNPSGVVGLAGFRGKVAR